MTSRFFVDLVWPEKGRRQQEEGEVCMQSWREHPPTLAAQCALLNRFCGLFGHVNSDMTMRKSGQPRTGIFCNMLVVWFSLVDLLPLTLQNGNYVRNWELAVVGQPFGPNIPKFACDKNNFDSVLYRFTICLLSTSQRVRMKKTSSSTLRRAWPSSDLLERLLPPAASVEPHRSRRSHSEKDYRMHKHSKRNRYPPQYLCQSPPAYIHTGTVQPHR